jgi:hypothetical protein
MGLLDDAIREHLDLKRRRGADPAEIERAEREALGPVRRGPEDGEPDEPAAAPEAAPEAAPVAYDQQADEEWGESFEEESEPELPEFLAERPKPLMFEDEHKPVDYDEDATSEPVGRHEATRIDEPPAEDEASPVEDSVGAHEPPEREPELPATPAPHPAPMESGKEPATGETAEYDVEHALSQEHDEHADDMLEETPEFLQDAPDHDRLWFEQRPPRDFDFDG